VKDDKRKGERKRKAKNGKQIYEERQIKEFIERRK
jgi:hypothetical protein